MRVNTVTYLRCAGGGRTPEGFHGRQVLRFKRRRWASTGAGVGVSGEPLIHLPGGAERNRNTYCARRERDVTCHPTEVTLKRIYARTSTIRLRLMHHKKRKVDALHLNICIILVTYRNKFYLESSSRCPQSLSKTVALRHQFSSLLEETSKIQSLLE